MENLTLVQKFAVLVLPVLFAITVHEVAHGWVAKKRGDNTAFMLGRLTLNPIKHIDLVGTIMVPGLLLLLGNFVFGWAKPVPVDWHKLRNPKTDMIWVALAGPFANLLMAFGWAIVAKIGMLVNAPGITIPLLYMGTAGLWINLLLMVLNLIPIPPLDGGRVMAGLLPPPLALKYARIEPFGLIIVLTLFVTGIIGPIMRYPLGLFSNLIIGIVGL